MANQFTSDFVEFVRALTGLESMSGGAVSAYLLVSVVTFLGSRRGPLTTFVAKRPKLARFFGFLAALGMNWNKAEDLAKDLALGATKSKT